MLQMTELGYVLKMKANVDKWNKIKKKINIELPSSAVSHWGDYSTYKHSHRAKMMTQM